MLITLNVSFAQSDSAHAVDSVTIHHININSNLNSAKIFLDTLYIGETPLTNFGVAEGNYKIRIINPKSLKNWEDENTFFEIYINKDTTIYTNFRYFYFISSNPFNAHVFKKDSLLGITPLRFFSEEELTGTLTLKKKNFKDYSFDLTKYNFETGTNITLQSKGIETIKDIVYKDRGTQFKTKRNVPLILGFGAASLAGAFLAINFKNNANEDYNRYVFTGNNESLDSSNRNDTYFVITLVLMQAAIGGLIYFLFFD